VNSLGEFTDRVKRASKSRGSGVGDHGAYAA
jgi:hypothetical protein